MIPGHFILTHMITAVFELNRSRPFFANFLCGHIIIYLYPLPSGKLSTRFLTY